MAPIVEKLHCLKVPNKLVRDSDKDELHSCNIGIKQTQHFIAPSKNSDDLKIATSPSIEQCCSFYSYKANIGYQQVNDYFYCVLMLFFCSYNLSIFR